MITKTVLITGCSSGIGYLAALEFARNGYITFASARNLEAEGIKSLAEITRSEGLLLEIIHLDVTDAASVDKAVDLIIHKRGHLDVLINNAGYGYVTTAEDIELNKLQHQYETNIFGPLRLMQRVLPNMRQLQAGIIINISSVLGFCSVPLHAAYSSSKYALESISETMAAEVKPFGINVVLVEPGSFDTKFSQNVKHGERSGDSPYAKLFQKNNRTQAFSPAQNPAKIARLLLKIAGTPEPKLRYTVGWDSFTMRIVHTLLPGRLWIKLIRLTYKW
jgi:NAD(P)-dependent dehydrogenase (short-subunit alcohol dehydrogenase family)